MSRRRTLLVAGAAAFAAGLIAGPALWERLRGNGAWLRETAFADLSGARRSLSEWQARLLIVNFWATWCAPCREEIPLLMAVRRAHAARGLQVLGIAIDAAAKVADYANTMAIDYPLLVADASGLELMRRLGNAHGALPYSVFVDGDGKVRHRKLGALGRAELDGLVGELLG